MRPFLVVAALLFACPAVADGVATAQPASLTRSQTTQPKTQLYCRFVTHEGMVVGRPVCLSRARWEQIGYNARRALQDYQHRHYSR